MTITAESHEFYTGRRWTHLREVILRRDGYCDQVLKRYGKLRQAENVHHIFPREEFPEYQYESWNLISLTHNTHMAMHIPATGELSPEGIDLLRRTCRKYGKEIPLRYR